MSKANKKNLAPKIISIIFALVLWIYVIDTINPEESRLIPNISVRLINVEELAKHQLAIKDHDDLKVRARVIGRREEINNISVEQIQVRADVKGYGAGTNNIPLEVVAPGNVEVNISPRFIRVDLENIIDVQKEVRVLTTGVPRENYVVGDLQYKPTRVTVSGPESDVNAVEYVSARLDTRDASRNFAVSLALKPVNNKGEEVTNVEIGTSHVEARLQIDMLKTVPVRPNLQLGIGDGYTVTNAKINPKEVVLRGQEDILKDIVEVTTEPLKIDNLSQDRAVEVKLKLPEGVVLHDNITVFISLNLEQITEATYKVSKDKIIFNNIDEKLKVDTSNMAENIDVKIVAFKSILDSIKEDDIKIAIDLKGLDANEYTIEPVVQLPHIGENDIKELQLNPKTINIKLVEK